MPNYFASPGAAERYAQARPYFHPVVIAKVRQRLGLAERLGRALDVGCGTGQSAVALLEIASKVYGADCSLEMLRLAIREPRLRYTAAAAEALPFGAGQMDLVTAALAFHWLERGAFLGEARRVLKPDGWLVLYDNGFRAKMAEEPAFGTWMREVYNSRFPAPARQAGVSSPFGEAEALAAGFRFDGRETYDNTVIFDLPQLVAYLTTQSNIIAAVEHGQHRLGEVAEFLTSALSPFFAGRRHGTFLFGGHILYLQRLASG